MLFLLYSECFNWRTAIFEKHGERFSLVCYVHSTPNVSSRGGEFPPPIERRCSAQLAEGKGFEPLWDCPKRFSRPPRYDHFDIPPYPGGCGLSGQLLNAKRSPGFSRFPAFRRLPGHPHADSSVLFTIPHFVAFVKRNFVFFFRKIEKLQPASCNSYNNMIYCYEQV